MADRFWKYSLVGYLAITCPSCSVLLSKAFGIQDERHESVEYQKSYLTKYEIDTAFMANLQPGSFPKLSSPIYSLDTFTNQGFTPIQFRVYNADGMFYTGWEQCFGNPKRINFYDSFPRVAPSHWPLNRTISFQKDLELIDPVNFKKNTILTAINSKQYDYIVIGFWAGYLGGLSKSMLKELTAAINTSGKRILFIKVNLGAG